jgi:hypothetical protein
MGHAFRNRQALTVFLRHATIPVIDASKRSLPRVDVSLGREGRGPGVV